ncbi:hypothetical protein JXJ21_04860 [candidate division KSB1 bacterium]|nr:hypothetical protein [candidate division KSB1 bacterium]
MKPHIDKTGFGWIVIDGARYEYDVLIRPDGKIKKRKKALSKKVYGTSHKVSKEEAKHIFKHAAEKLVVGTGQTGLLELSDDARKFFAKHHCGVELHPTPEAIDAWNRAGNTVIGLFHLTC